MGAARPKPKTTPRVRRTCVLVALLLGLVELNAASAQELPTPPYARAGAQAGPAELSLQAAPVARASTANSVLIAAVGSALGAVAGGFIGYSIDRARDVPSEDPGLAGLILGGLAGSAILSPTLLHVANGGRGPLGRAILFSLAGTTVSAAAFWHAGPFLFVVPAVQVAVSVAILD